MSVIDLFFSLPILNLDPIAQLFTMLLVRYIRGKAGLHSGSLRMRDFLRHSYQMYYTITDIFNNLFATTQALLYMQVLIKF